MLGRAYSRFVCKWLRHFTANVHSAVTPLNLVLDAMQYLAPSDHNAVIQILQTCGLPTEDLNPEFLVHFVGTFYDKKLVAVGGLQIIENVALLRSVATLPSERNTGIGTKIVNELESYASGLGIDNIYLLTESASSYFGNLGYNITDRIEAPATISATSQFTDICPDSAVLMCKRLGV